MTVFSTRSAVQTRRVELHFDADSVKRIFDTRGFDAVYHDHELWSTIGCFWSLARPLPLETIGLARLDDSNPQDVDLLAMTGLSSRISRISGECTPLSNSELQAVEKRYRDRLPSWFASGKVLRHGDRYRSEKAGELLEVFLGRPYQSPADSGPPIDSIRIVRLFVRGDRLLAVDRLFRTSGVEEHVDVEPPRLDDVNWYQVSELTMGFLSFDRGASWHRLSVDVGFEGVEWTVRRLGDHSPIWSFYLYTSH